MSKPGNAAGFSLVELLVVVAIMAVLMAITLPSFQALSGQAIEQAGQQTAQVLNSARDLALTRNKWIEVRLIKTAASPGDEETYRTLQVWQRKDDGTSAAVSKFYHLPQAVSFAEDAGLSPLLQGHAGLSGLTKVMGADKSYVALLLRPDGSPDEEAMGNQAACLTIVPERQRKEASLPPNFRSLTINPITGEIRMLRP